jgi:hypothetical protein
LRQPAFLKGDITRNLGTGVLIIGFSNMDTKGHIITLLGPSDCYSPHQVTRERQKQLVSSDQNALAAIVESKTLRPK